MENLAYLHLADAHEDSQIIELISWSSLFQKSAVPNWKRLSSKAWKYMLPLALTLSILNTVSSVLALETGNQQNANLSWHDVVEVITPEKLEQKLEPDQKIPGTNSTIATTTNTPKITTFNSITKKRQNPHFLVKGDEGEDVSVLQVRLRVAGFYYGNPTGIFGPITEEAVKRFQQAYKLNVDGVVGAGTLAKLPPLESDGEQTAKKATNPDQLSLGDRGEAVRILQEHLIKAGYLNTQPNGYYGSHTADAVSRFQKHHRLEVNSIAGPTTRAKLHHLVKTSAKSDFTVLEIQRRLQEKGFYKGQINGLMAVDTQKAIQRAQEFYGISLSDIKNGNF
ncbi:peptidoglycan-binding protein [Sphaerospermopsis aphanizomenoides BCCUSP55]|uniref:peptidoglycan-binding domain-containing protein n=1 Tax=Sphaerospermopsis aphanizomenoides TaxID=459663 RepID=UPI000B18E685|nr:peptidoglycan-binding protein [Sphaerospermopsis aphanizomenoides]MBK1986638.1 peptidoglycan-binding protein [Sphaerospermopsis aphanizomenoides BCCUSP55]